MSVRIAGGILAGGLSSRMGAPKEGIVLRDGRAMIEHVAEALRPLVEKLLVVGASRGFDPARLGAEHLDDRRPDSGPLAGIEALLASNAADVYIVVTCDQPRLDGALLARLLPVGDGPVAFRAEGGEELLPFPVALPARLLGVVSRALDAGERSPRRVLASVSIDWRVVSEAEARQVGSVNTPEELRDLVDRG
jgi:molybdopterin-guanine dinucleotide biosynthesis protein A